MQLHGESKSHPFILPLIGQMLTNFNTSFTT